MSNFIIFKPFIKIKNVFQKNRFRPLRCKNRILILKNSEHKFLQKLYFYEKIFRGFFIYPIMIYNGYTNFTPKTPKFLLL
jgi:hypothetical protein